MILLIFSAVVSKNVAVFEIIYTVNEPVRHNVKYFWSNP